jgi:hypothetical protein
MSTKNRRQPKEKTAVEEDSEEVNEYICKQEREYIQSEIVRMFKAEWYQAGPLKERARVMLKSKCASNYNVSELHMFTALRSWSERHEWPKSQLEDYERGILAQFIKLMASDDAPLRLKMLAELTKRFPVSEPAPNFNNWRSGPDWFRPTRQEGLKPVMLGAFFALIKERAANPLPAPLPTIGELDALVKHAYISKNKSKEKKPPGEKELRNARRELGLSGLPRGKSGRQEKPRGKK